MSPPDPKQAAFLEECREEIRQARWLERLFVARLRELEAIEEATEDALSPRLHDFDLEHEPELAAAIDYGGKINLAVTCAREALSEFRDRIDKFGGEVSAGNEGTCIDAEHAVIALRQTVRDLGAVVSSEEVAAVYAKNTAGYRRSCRWMANYRLTNHRPLNEAEKRQQINWMFG